MFKDEFKTCLKLKMKKAFELQMGKTPARADPSLWKSADHKWISIADMSTYDFEMPANLEDDEIEVILAKADELVSWANDIKEYALQQAVSGKEWKDWKLVEGRSNRRYVNDKAVAEKIESAGYDPYEKKVIGITAMTKMLGKTKFEELLSGLIEKPQGKPTLVPMSDKRPAMKNTAINDFKEDN